MSEQMEKTAVKITVTYDDGTTKEVEKGVVWQLTDIPEEEKIDITAEMVSMSGKDLFTVVNAAVEIGMRLGMFGNPNEMEDET